MKFFEENYKPDSEDEDEDETENEDEQNDKPGQDTDKPDGETDEESEKLKKEKLKKEKQKKDKTVNEQIEAEVKKQLKIKRKVPSQGVQKKKPLIEYGIASKGYVETV